MRMTVFVSLLMTAALVTVPAGGFPGKRSDRSTWGAFAGVEPDSLAETVQFLSIDPGTLEYRTRFCLREAELFEITTYLAGRLEEITGGPPVLDSFEIVRDFGDGDTTFTVYNIIADADLYPGGDDVVLITAHYDAAGSRSPGYYGEWETAPAPGANDNGTGVAALLEAARVLCLEELPFDLRFVLFSGEELGRLGSIDYVGKCDLDPQCPGRILGVINLDMLGYSGEGQGVSIMSDEYSGWLAYALEETAGRLAPSLVTAVIRPGPWNWDHASFWEKDGVPVSAITLAEPLEEDGGIIYPDYHTYEDVPGNVDFEQVGMIAGVLTGFILEKAAAPPEFTMFDTDMVFYVDGVERSLKDFHEADDVSVHVKVRNIGGSPAGTEDIRLRVIHRASDDSEVLFDGEVDVPEVLRTSDTVIPLPAGSMKPGG
ncbi:MAG TPA: M28 family peptidase, partial [Candidatus Krumholzibacterium sp.]|nr:M28 family peptidase [Candidatus Krumholzibacterium sp.]